MFKLRHVWNNLRLQCGICNR